MDVFTFIVDDIFFVQRNDAIAEHFGVHAEILVVAQEGEHGVRDAADPHLESGPVLDELGDAVQIALGQE